MILALDPGSVKTGVAVVHKMGVSHGKKLSKQKILKKKCRGFLTHTTSVSL